jgi:hypothetical protein
MLGPLLFIIYINDLPLGIKTCSKPVLFAYDIRVLITANGLSLNIDKTNAIKINLSCSQEDSF